MAKKKGIVKRYMVTPDKHFPLHDEKAINVLIKAIGIIKPDGYIDLGDLGEWNNVSHWKWQKKARPPLDYILKDLMAEVAGVKEQLDRIDEALDKVNIKDKYLLQGNHDLWLDSFVEEHPYLPEYKFKNVVDVKARKYKYYPADKFLKIGKLNYHHGHYYAGICHTRNHLQRLGVNIMYGHHHDLQQYSVTHIDGVKSAWSVGCLKDMSNEKNVWLRGRPVNWAHAFAVVDYFDKGNFTVHIVQIIDGKCSLWGELVSG